MIEPRASGHEVFDEVYCQQHTNLMPELAAELLKLRVIARARELSQQPGNDLHAEAPPETVAYEPAQRRGRCIFRSSQIRCPLCYEPLEIAADQSLDDQTCKASRPPNSRFLLILHRGAVFWSPGSGAAISSSG